MATSTHNKYVSIPDWFSSSSSTPITSAEKPANITNVYYGGGSGGGTTEIQIDNKTIVWLDLVITVPIDNDKIIINTEGKITTSGTTGVWELRQLTDGTNYIYTTYPVVTQLGITMYAGTDGLDLGSIYDGLPIDNATIYWDLDENGNKILKAVGSSGGVADSVAWANVIGKPDWLLDGKVLYTEIEGIPDLSGFITKDYIDGKFVTFDLDETIDGIKTFTNGIKIGNSLINQSLNDVIYIDANLAVRGGITMYATGTVDIPSILDSLPVAGTESKGIASFDSSYFSVTNGKVTLLADNVGLNESELAEYLNSNNYAKKSDIPSLNGYATQSWVESKGYALNSDLVVLTTKVDDFLEGSDTDTIINKWLELEAFLSGLSESDNLATILGNKADKSELTKYIPISGYTEVSGEKNFTGGLKVNGSPIYYDTEKKYWKLEGDLLVTGGVTMYGSDSSFTPSTIMDAIAVDGTTISKSGGVLKVIGGTGGGVADSVAWANITGKPTWIGSSKPNYSYSEITGAISTTELQNYLTQNSYLNVTSGDNRYLKLSGGTLSFQSAPTALTIKRTESGGGAWIDFCNNDGKLGAIGIGGSQSPLPNCIYFHDPLINKDLKIWHEGNDGSGSGLDADLLDGQEGSWYQQNTLGFARHNYTNNTASERDANAVTDGMLYNYGSTNYWKNTPSGLSYGQILSLSSANDSGLMGQLAWDINNASTSDTTRTLWWRGIQSKDNISYAKWHQIAFTDSNVASATKLQTARTIWGQSFDGTGNIDGVITINQSTTNASILINSTHASLPQSFITFQSNGVDKGNVGWTNASGTHLYNASTRKTLELTNDGELKYGAAANGVVIWRADNSNLSTVNWTASDLYCYCNGAARQFVVSKKSYTWGGLVNSYPLIGTTSAADNDIYTMLAFPHIPYLKNGSRNYNGNSFGSLVRFEGDVTNGKYWDVGCPSESPNNLFIKCDGKNIASWGDTGLMGIYVPNQWLSSSMLVLGRKDASLMTKQYAQIGVTDGNIHVDAYKGYGIYLNFYQSNTGVVIDKDCNLLVSGGITMYSDKRKKTILNHVELSLKQIAEAPIIEHYYNSDEKKTTHVGSIAQYWYGLNDWFCKEDSEGYLTMEIQNAALASAISIARELDRYETKTDKAIKKLKKRICELEEEVERLKSA